MSSVETLATLLPHAVKIICAIKAVKGKGLIVCTSFIPMMMLLQKVKIKDVGRRDRSLLR